MKPNFKVFLSSNKPFSSSSDHSQEENWVLHMRNLGDVDPLGATENTKEESVLVISFP